MKNQDKPGFKELLVELQKSEVTVEQTFDALESLNRSYDFKINNTMIIPIPFSRAALLIDTVNFSTYEVKAYLFPTVEEAEEERHNWYLRQQQIKDEIRDKN